MTLPGQMELATVIDHTKHYPEWQIDESSRSKAENMLDADHPALRTHEDVLKSSGLRLAKMVTHYEDYPSSDAWRDMQRLARDMQK